MTGRSAAIRADAHHLPLADNSVDLICTSPPYFALRSYTDGGAHYAGQVGDEATPQEFIYNLLAVTAECVRVLKPTGSLFVNLGDKYSGAQAQNIAGQNRAGDSARTWAQTNPANTGIRAKSLIGLPWRYALGCIDQLGLILRAEVIWAKPNGLPESVTDRVRRSHEQWFHFVLQPRYFSAVDEVREPHEGSGKGMSWADRLASPTAPKSGFREAGERGSMSGVTFAGNPLGKLPGSVWTIPTAPLQVPAHLGVDHFAAFPPEWPRRIIQGWSPSGVCEACGEGRRPVTSVTPVESKPFAVQQHERSPLSGGTRTQGLGYAAADRDRTITGYACACPDTTAPTRPAVVIDPFGGTGTTAMVARALGRTGLSFDLSHDYSRLAHWRINDAAQRAKVRGEDFRRPEPQIDGQGDLFGGAA